MSIYESYSEELMELATILPAYKLLFNVHQTLAANEFDNCYHEPEESVVESEKKYNGLITEMNQMSLDVIFKRFVEKLKTETKIVFEVWPEQFRLEVKSLGDMFGKEVCASQNDINELSAKGSKGVYLLSGSEHAGADDKVFLLIEFSADVPDCFIELWWPHASWYQWPGALKKEAEGLWQIISEER